MNDKTYVNDETYIRINCRNAALAAYFGARSPTLQTLADTHVFEAGFDRGWQAFAVASPPAPAAQAERVPADVVERVFAVFEGWKSATYSWQGNDPDGHAKALSAHNAECKRRIAAALATQPPASAGDAVRAAGRRVVQLAKLALLFAPASGWRDPNLPGQLRSALDEYDEAIRDLSTTKE